MRLSLRGRLALWYILAVACLILALALVARHVMVGNLRAGLDETLEERTQIAASAIKTDLAKNPKNYTDVIYELVEREFSSIPLLLRISDPNGKFITTFGDVPSSIVPNLNSQFHRPDINQGRFANVKIRGQEALRVYTVALKDPATGEIFALIQTGESLEQVDAAQDQLWRYTIVVAVAGSLLALAVGMLILHRALRPLDRILKRVQAIESSNLQAGLPDEPRPPELQQLADSLNLMWTRLNTAFKAKQMFVANVSHDLRTPLTALQGQIEVLLMQPAFNPEARESLERMAKEVRRLIRMTNNLLLNAQLETNPAVSTEAVNLRELAEEVISELWVLAEELELELVCPEDVVMPGDYDLLKQMVLNIMDNAIKFTPAGGHIRLTMTRQEGWTTLEVSDTGPGIPREHLSRIMEPFYKVNGARRAAPGGEGAGLGLAIVKQIVELHHGQVEILSLEGVGATVKVRLPALDAKVLNKPAKEALAQGPSRSRAEAS